MEAMIEAFSLSVVRNAFFAMLIAGATLSLLGVIIVSLNLTAIRFTLMHTGLLGAALGIALGFQPLPGAFIVVLAASVGMALISDASAISSSSASGMIMTASLAGAFILLAVAGVPAMQVFDIFAGNILMLTTIDVIVTSVLGLVTALFFIFTYRETQLVLMDKELAYNLGLPVKALTTMMFVLLGIGVASALRLVGALLVDAIILLPAIAALRLASRFSLALVLTSLFGLLATTAGFMIALALDWPVGSTTALCSVSILAGALVVRRKAH
jgi:ABC-type Mn2+/Zn2+ transport system permease subunit